MGEVVNARSFQQNKQLQELLSKVQTIPERYTGDIRRYLAYCAETQQSDSIESMFNYLSYSINEQRVKKTTWERRLAAIKKHFLVTHGKTLTLEQQNVVSQLRKVYSLDDYKDQTLIKGQPALDQTEVLERIHKLPVREKAICLVNLITANRPTEMVRLKVGDFNFANRSVTVYLKKQKDWKSKRLTQETVKAVKEYIQAYELQPADHFVGRVRRGGHYESAQIGEVSYNRLIQKWLEFAPYTFRKTLISSMHLKGADLSTIAKQSGHKSVAVISKHYLNVNDTTVDQYL